MTVAAPEWRQGRNDSERRPEQGTFNGVRGEFTADFHALVRLTPVHGGGVVQFQIVNLDGFETVTVVFSTFEVGSARLGELARWLVGEPNPFLKAGQQLRRVEA